MKTGMNLNLWSAAITEEHYPLFAALKETGFDGVELVAWEGSVDHFEVLAKELASQGLEATALTSCNLETNPISPDRAVRAAAVEHLRQSVERAHALGAEVLVGPFHSAYAEFVGRGPTADERGWCAEVLRPVAEEAEAAGIRLAVEFLNRFECYFLTTAADARELVRQVDHPALGILYDTHHAHIEERDPAATIQACAAEIKHVHVSENDRGIPGTGQVAWDATFRALKEADYDGWLVIEAFSRRDPEFAANIRVWRDYFKSPDDVQRQGFAFIRSMWAR
jgi:D-psicose/D-tagatose/L-ribulose 3-epimerase